MPTQIRKQAWNGNFSELLTDFNNKWTNNLKNSEDGLTIEFQSSSMWTFCLFVCSYVVNEYLNILFIFILFLLHFFIYNNYSFSKLIIILKEHIEKMT